MKKVYKEIRNVIPDKNGLIGLSFEPVEAEAEKAADGKDTAGEAK